MYIYLSIYQSFDVLGWVGWWVTIAMFWGCALYECLDIIIKAILDNNKICIAFNPFFKALYMDDWLIDNTLGCASSYHNLTHLLNNNRDFFSLFKNFFHKLKIYSCMKLFFTKIPRFMGHGKMNSNLTKIVFVSLNNLVHDYWW